MIKKIAMIIGISILLIFVIVSVFAPLFTKYDTDKIDLESITMPPSEEHYLGTDEFGRDVFTRLLYGGRISLFVGTISTLIQLVIGVTLGVIAGYYGGLIESIIMRIVDIIMCFPFFVIAISMAAIIGPNIWNVIFIIGILSWTGIARIVRAEVLYIKKKEYVDSSIILGFGDFKILIRDILPNILSPIIIAGTLSVANGILSEAALSFLGLGVKLPQPSWGNMLSAAQNMRDLEKHWWLWLPPGLCVFLTVIAINLLGDGLRDLLDPKQKQ